MEAKVSEQRSNRILQHAAEKCASSGTKLTAKRRQVLEVLVKADAPLSAYDVVDHYNAASDQNIQPMSAYRILDFLVSENLVHKLKLANRYVACSHIACGHEHAVQQFLICRECHQVRELAIPANIIRQLSESIDQSGYRLMNPQLELDCLCPDCQPT